LAKLNPGELAQHEMRNLWILRANALHDLGRDEEAVEGLDVLARLCPEQAAFAAIALFNLRRYRELISFLSRHSDSLASNAIAQILLASSSTILGDFDAAIAFCDAALARKDEPHLRLFREVLRKWGDSYVRQITSHGANAEAPRVWPDIRTSIAVVNIIALFRDLIGERTLPVLRSWIRESKLDDEFLPLTVAMEYLETGDRAPLEKLSAEIRPIAEEIVAELQKKLPTPAKHPMHKAHA